MLKQVIGNTAWLAADKILRIGVGLVVGVWVARYLGPQEFGLLSYSVAIVSLFSALAGLGLNGIVVRDLIQKPDIAHSTLGTAFLLQLVGGFLAFVFAVAAVILMRPADDLARTIVAILGFASAFRATDVVKYWFESRVQSKYSVWAEDTVFLLLAGTRLTLVAIGAPLLAFVWAAFAETALAAALLLAVYSRKVEKLSAWRVSLSRATALLMESWPMTLSSVASMINMRMDQIMLGAMTTDTVVGNYSAAVRISEAWLMVPTILGSSIFPSIIAAKNANEALYRSRIIKIPYYMAWAVLPTALLITTSANQISHLLYGKAYEAAGTYLAILIWSGVPYLIFFVLNQMLYIERLVRISFYVAVYGVLCNVALNLILIPVYGGKGAASATLITSISTVFLSLFILNLKTGIFWRSRNEEK